MNVTGPDRGPHTLKGWLPWVVVGVVMVVLAAVAVTTVFFTGPGNAEDAETVQDVADLAVDAAETLDVAAGIDLLCEAPMDLYRMSLESTIAEAQDRAGTETPDVTYTVRDVSDAATGSFVVDITSDEVGLADEDTTVRVFVEDRDGRSCVAGVGSEDDAEPEVTLSGDGYDGATSPSASPTP